MNKGVLRFLSVCALVLSVTVLSVPIAGLMGVIGTVESVKESELRVGFMQKVDSLNPYVGLNDAAYIFYGLVYDAMNVIDNAMNPYPDLAKGIYAVPLSDPEMQNTGAPYGSIWQYNLTTNAYWTDGEPFTADDVVFNVNLNANNFEAMWAYQPYSYFMKNAVKVNDSTVRIYFHEKLNGTLMPASFAYLISIPMLPKHLLGTGSMNAFDIAFNWSGVFEGTDMPIVSTGPFMGNPNIREEWLSGDHITLLKNPKYHWKLDKPGAPEIKFDKLTMYFYDDSTAMSYALQNKQLDIASFPPQAYKAIKDKVASGSLRNVTTFEGPKITQYWTEIGVNMGGGGPNPSRLDHTIREAMAMATNKSYIVENYYLGLADEGTTLIPPVNTYWHYEPTAAEKFTFDIEAAKALLQNAGYIDGPDTDTIRECTASSYAVKEGIVEEGTPLQYEMLLRREYPEERDIAMYLEDQWAKVGIDINYLILDESALSTRVYSYGYDTMIWYWSADIDPNYQLFVQSKDAWDGWSDNYYTNPAYEENYSKSVNTLDKAQRKEYVDNCQRVNYLDAAYIILAYPYQTYAWRTDTFSGWGDWAADPGRSMDNFWMGNPLFFDLVPGNPPEDGTNWLLVAGAAAGIAVVVAAVVLLRMKGKKKEGSIKDESSPLGD